jgi:hypothetical protein
MKILKIKFGYENLLDTSEDEAAPQQGTQKDYNEVL